MTTKNLLSRAGLRMLRDAASRPGGNLFPSKLHGAPQEAVLNNLVMGGYVVMVENAWVISRKGRVAIAPTEPTHWICSMCSNETTRSDECEYCGAHREFMAGGAS
jgi:methionyl-tRNA synthetase